MKILQLVKWYHPWKGGMESVVKNLVDGILGISKNTHFSVYANKSPICKKEIEFFDRVTIIKEYSQFYIKSQPISFGYKSLRKLIKENDVIHHHYPFPTMELALLRNLKKIENKSFIITWHANIANSRWSWIEKIYDPIINKLLKRADWIIITSPQILELSQILKQYRNKVKVIPLSFDPKFSSSKRKEYPTERVFNLLFVGKLRKYKGLEYLLKAVEHLPVKLNIVGDGEEKDALERQVEFLNLKNKVSFYFDLSDNELSLMYKKSDLFILPSVNEAEAFGVVQLEAMSNGLPVINTNLKSGVPYVSLNEITGLTVEPKNTEALKKAIERIIFDKRLFEEFSTNSLSRSLEFSRNKMAQSYFNLY
jgi:glycosyltransferase involved in cell wall biosynthesis